MRPIRRTLLLAALFATVLPALAADKPKPPGLPTVTALPSPFKLGGARGAPAYLRPAPDALAGPDGVAGGEVKSVDVDFASKDFTFDVHVRFDPGQNEFVLGLGENARDGNFILNSIALRWSGRSGYADLVTKRSDRTSLGRLDPAGPHLIRLEKRADALTLTVANEADGKLTAVASKTIPDLKKSAPFLTDKNASLFFAGEGTVTAVALAVDGKPVDPGPAVDDKAVADRDAEVDKVPLVPLAGQAGVPSWLAVNPRVLADARGIAGGEVRTAATDLAEHDFVCDLLFNFADAQDKHGFVAGLGENRRDGGWVRDSLYARVGSPDGKGKVTVGPGTKYGDHDLGAFGDRPGPHMLRVEKRGNTLTWALCVDYKDTFVPAFSKTLPDLKRSAPFLTKLNAGIFFDPGQTGSRNNGVGGARLQAARLIVDGKPAPNAAPAAAAADDSAVDRLPLTSFAGQSGLPPWIKASAEALAGPDGIRGGELRTLDNDLASKDFTFDLLYQFAEDDNKSFLVGIGENGRNGGWILNSVCSRIHGPAHKGLANVILPKNQTEEATLGETALTKGPHMFRVQKRGNTLTLAIHPDYDGDKFKPMFSRTIPDLARVAPFLNRTNASLFVHGNGGTLRGARMVVAGKPLTGGATVATATGPKTTAATPADDLAGAQHLIKLRGPTGAAALPTYLQPQRDLKFDAKGGLFLKDVTLRTKAADLLDKDFTFDVVYRFDDRGGGPVVGIGENGHDGSAAIVNSVCSRLHGPSANGLCTVTIFKRQESELCRSGKGDGPNLFRLQKRGNTLTMSVCPNFTDKFEPAFSRTIPDLASVAPFLTAKNSQLFVGGAGFVDAVRLVITGEAVESRDLALDVPARAVEGKPIRQQIVKAPGDRRFAIDAAPKGLLLSPAGQLAWTPAHDQVGRHEIRVKITAGKETTVATVEIEVVAAEDAAAVAGDLAKVDALYRLPLAGDKYFYATGLAGRSALLLEGDSLKRLAPDGFTVKQTLKLPARYTMIAERDDYFVALSDEKQSLDLIDPKTLAVRRSVKMEYRARHDMALNPAKPITYVTVEKGGGGDGPQQVVLIVNESTGEVLEPDNFIGRWVKVAPDGREVYTGYKEVYQKGSRLLINPDRIHVVPEYGSIDVLFVYDVTGPRPREVRMKDAPGANGNGIALSPDGRRLSYLSFTGYPIYSGNVPAFDPANFDKRPVTYPTKANKAKAQDVAFHPLLDVAAAAGDDGAVCFDRETGDVLGDLPDQRNTPAADRKATRAYFSPDGRNLILECAAAGDKGARYLRRVKLNLSPEQLKAIEHPPAPAPPPPAGTGVKGLPKA